MLSFHKEIQRFSGSIEILTNITDILFVPIGEFRKINKKCSSKGKII